MNGDGLPVLPVGTMTERRVVGLGRMGPGAVELDCGLTEVELHCGLALGTDEVSIAGISVTCDGDSTTAVDSSLTVVELSWPKVGNG